MGHGDLANSFLSSRTGPGDVMQLIALILIVVADRARGPIGNPPAGRFVTINPLALVLSDPLGSRYSSLVPATGSIPWLPLGLKMSPSPS
jgi:hypothetical protein